MKYYYVYLLQYYCKEFAEDKKNTYDIIFNEYIIKYMCIVYLILKLNYAIT